MAGPKDVTIRAQALDGTWTVIGGEKARGIYPENVVLEADLWGSSHASFNLRRDPATFWPDISAFTPVEVDVGSTLVWSGRVQQTPSRVAQRVMNVQCEGWQYHLDDDIYERKYVHTRLPDYKDARSFLDCDLTAFRSAATVNTDGGIVASFAKDLIIAGGTLYAFAVLDLGPGQAAQSVALDWEHSANDANSFIALRGADSVAAMATGSFEALMASTITGGASGTQAGTFSTPRRFIAFGLFRGAAGTLTADVWVRARAIRVFADSSYVSAGSSVLKASTVVADAVNRATLLLSTDQSGIQATTFSMPEYAPGAPQTARQAWEAVDSYHDWLKQIDVYRRPIYQAKPSRPIFEVGAQSSIDDDDASANSGAEIYNRVIVGGQSPDGIPISANRFAGEQAGTPFLPVATPAPPNPSFDVDTSSWTLTGGTSFTRDTVDFLSAPASGKVTFGASIFTLSTTFTGTFRRGVTYRLVVGVKGGGNGIPIMGSFGVPGGDRVTVVVDEPFSGLWRVVEILWTPIADATGVQFVVQNVNLATAGTVWAVDSLQLSVAAGTLVDRRGFRRAMQLPVDSALPSDGVASGVIGDLWLAGHKTTPQKGSVTLTGDSSLREILTGADVSLERALLSTGQLLRYSDRSDPDTGGHGRDARIVGVSYQPATDTAALTLDNSRTSLAALLSRLSIVQGG